MSEENDADVEKGVPSFDRGQARVFKAVTALAGLLFAYEARAAEAQGLPSPEIEHRMVVGFGGAMDADLSGGSVHGGGSLFVEVTAIDEWLEVELGISALRADCGGTVPIDLLFKKPFRLSPRIELMVGLGPEMVSYVRSRSRGKFIDVEAVADLMFWPSPHVGFGIEPSYEGTARGGWENGLGGTASIIFGW